MQIHRLYLKVLSPVPGSAPVAPEFAWTEALVRRYFTTAARVAGETGSIDLLLPWLSARRTKRFATPAEVRHLRQARDLIESLPRGAPDRTALEIFIRRNASPWCPKKAMRALRWSRDSYSIALNGALLALADTMSERRIAISEADQIEPRDAQ